MGTELNSETTVPMLRNSPECSLKIIADSDKRCVDRCPILMDFATVKFALLVVELHHADRRHAASDELSYASRFMYATTVNFEVGAQRSDCNPSPKSRQSACSSPLFWKQKCRAGTPLRLVPLVVPFGSFGLLNPSPREKLLGGSRPTHPRQVLLYHEGKPLRHRGSDALRNAFEQKHPLPGTTCSTSVKPSWSRSEAAQVAQFSTISSAMRGYLLGPSAKLLRCCGPWFLGGVIRVKRLLSFEFVPANSCRSC